MAKRVAVKRRQLGQLGIGAAALAAATLCAWRWWDRLFPPDTTPEGAYLRIADAMARGTPRDAFPYLEEDAQVACYTIHGYARKAAEAIAASYPEPERTRALARYQRLSEAEDPPAVWVAIAEDRGWLARLRADLSGIASVEIVGERASVTTARGTRYALRRRPNGIWGLTQFTGVLHAEALRLARDSDLVDKARADFLRGKDR